MAPAVARLAAALLLFAGWPLAASPSHAQEIPPAYEIAAQRAGVPAPVLFAIALQESGIERDGTLMPWPWTLNVAGVSRRFATHAEACVGLIEALRKVPPTRVDAGLGQINLGYHKQRYGHPCDLLDPDRNLTIAAEILREQYRPGEDWLLAAGRYHRPAGGAPAARYRRGVSRHLARVLGQPGTSHALTGKAAGDGTER
ncbi:transglycosylase SLT domain-containing protein [Xanthobacter autotrophicus]|uniref:transglycosylase SLT domain-containing protein n=1 Tax=Xanthobacter autotrophicus TaxID=280 RepID=UPI0037286E7B